MDLGLELVQVVRDYEAAILRLEDARKSVLQSEDQLRTVRAWLVACEARKFEVETRFSALKEAQDGPRP